MSPSFLKRHPWISINTAFAMLATGCWLIWGTEGFMAVLLPYIIVAWVGTDSGGEGPY